ncbi:ferredoxin [Clostridium novyi A str. NCTC 538]|uniref:Pyruvate synthase subunit porD n=1 Tax=Clostridium novyi (strain NT) TaxID=386415 RepID=A0Q203_CLONN|nr:pyruvate synthase subunit porD [Clostridium novyi NT]KEH85783.1 ferredoxin [Clostridium novyi A str. BKT29909]KEH88075.1 ferredoxin [Clostridium novyi A str. NCTC 538]KEH91781.1 ferredoxin [Clostridium botulinum C/D str. It1]
MELSKKMNVTSESKWNEIPIGGQIVDAGNSEEFKTGDWRAMKPVWHEDKCKNCMFCWAVCPDMSIIVKDGKVTGIDYDHCKGCGVCTKQCKFNALDFVAE